MTRDKAARRAALSSFSLPSVDLSFLSCPVLSLSLSLSLSLCFFFARVLRGMRNEKKPKRKRRRDPVFEPRGRESQLNWKLKLDIFFFLSLVSFLFPLEGLNY